MGFSWGRAGLLATLAVGCTAHTAGHVPGDYQMLRLRGRVLHASWSGEPLVATLLRQRQAGGAWEILDFAPLNAPESFSFIAEPYQTLRVGAFVDVDGDLKVGRNEAVAISQQIWSRASPSTGSAFVVEFGQNPEAAEILRSAFPGSVRARSLSFGDSRPLSDPAFTPKSGLEGLRNPQKFMAERDAGIYLIEPHIPGQDVVLLVHGLGGTPRDFRALVAFWQDRLPFTIAVAHYPSGWSPDDLVHYFTRGLAEFRARTAIAKIHVIADGTGALLTRATLSALPTPNAQGPVRTFISLGAPFGGLRVNPNELLCRSANNACEGLRPGATFIKHLHDAPLPQSIRMGLLFGTQDPGPMLDSQLATVAQAEADTVRGIKTEGRALLESPAAHKVITQILLEPRERR